MNGAAMSLSGGVSVGLNPFPARNRFCRPSRRNCVIAMPWPAFRTSRIICMADPYLLKKLESAENTWKELSVKLGDPDVVSNPSEYKKLAQSVAELDEVVATYKRYKDCESQLEETKGLVKEEGDQDMVEMIQSEISSLSSELKELEQKFKVLLLPSDPLDAKNILLEDALMPLQMLFEEFGFVAPPKNKGKGPAVTAAGYGLVPHQEPSDADVAFDSGHPASISNKLEQIPNYGDALAVTIPDKPTPPTVPASVPALASTSPAEASAFANLALLPSPSKTSAPATQAVDLDSETEEEEIEEGLSRTHKRPSDTSRPVSAIKKARAALQGKPPLSSPVVQAPTKVESLFPCRIFARPAPIIAAATNLLNLMTQQQANLDNINLERAALPNPLVDVNADAANLDPPPPPETNLADEDHTLLAPDAAPDTVAPVIPSASSASAHEASASGDARPSTPADCVKYLHEGFGPNDLESVRAAYQSHGVEALAADCARVNAWRSHMTTLLNLAQTEASTLRQQLAGVKEDTERANHFRSLCQEKSKEIEDLNLKLALLRSEFEDLERKMQQREADLSQATRNLQSERTARENAYLKLDDAKLALAEETEKLVKRTSELNLKVAEVAALDKEVLSQKLHLSEKDEIIRQKDEELKKRNEKIALLQAQVADLKLKSEPLPHIKEWVASPAFDKLCKLKAMKESVTMVSHLRYKLHQSYPDIDLNQFRLFPDERIMVNGVSMLRDFTAPPHPFLSSWPEAEQQKAFQKTLKHWKKYDDGFCYCNELPLPAEKYALFQAELDAYNARQERIKKCQAAGIEYDSDAEEVALPSEPSSVEDRGEQISADVEDQTPISSLKPSS